MEEEIKQSPKQEEQIKISKENNEPLLCECGQELSEQEYREGEGLCENCIRALK